MSLWRCIQYMTYIASIHNTALCRFGGHNLIVGRNNHSVGILLQSVRRIVAMNFRALSQSIIVKSHSVSLCLIASGFAQCSHWSVWDSRMVYSLVRVGMMSFITLYQVTFTAVDTGASCTFSHTICQSVFGHIRVMRITGWSFPTFKSMHMVVYSPHLYALSVSADSQPVVSRYTDWATRPTLYNVPLLSMCVNDIVKYSFSKGGFTAGTWKFACNEV